jgi:hypothetical protein
MLKVILSVLFFGFTAQAACPDLTGTFFSKAQTSDEADTTVEVTQTETAGVTTFNFLVKSVYNGNEEYTMNLQFIADGQTRVVEDADAGGVYAVSETFSCSDNQLNEVYSESYTEKSGKVSEKIEGTGVLMINSEADLSYATEHTDLEGTVTKGTSIYKRQ